MYKGGVKAFTRYMNVEYLWWHGNSFLIICPLWGEFAGLESTVYLTGVPDLWDRNKILSGGDLSNYQVPHCIRVFFYFVWFVFIHHNFQFYFELCTYCSIMDIYQYSIIIKIR